MQNVTTKAMAKVAAIATGLAMATSMLALAPLAHAASCTFTSDLTIGSRGDAVTCLQNTLISNGYSIPAGATGYFGVQTQAAVSAWQKASGISPTAGYFGPKSRAAFAAMGGGTVTTGLPAGCTSTVGYSPITGVSCATGVSTTVPGNGLRVMLSPSSPNGTVLVQKQGIGDLGDFVFTNPSANPINVTGLSFKRIGVSNDATLTNVYLYNGGTRITDSAGVSNSAFNFSDPTAIFTVPANSTYTVSVRSDIADNTSGQQIGVQLVSASSNGTLDASVSFPISSGFQTISAANLATVNYSVTTSPAAATSISPQSDYPVWQNTVSVSTNAVWLKSMRFTNLGSIDSAYVNNLRLYVDGVQAGSAIASLNSDRTVTFDLTANPVLLSTSSHTIKVLANITGGASRTIQFSVQRSSDAMFVDSQLGQPVTPLLNSGTFSAVTAGVSHPSALSDGPITINSVSGTSGVSVSLDPASPTQAVAVGASSVEFARFDFLASGENTKVSDLYVYATNASGAGGLANGKILVNGVQVGSTKSIGANSGAATDFSLGSSLILPAGQTTIVSIYADAKDTANANIANGTSVTVTLLAGSSNAQGQSSLNSANVPAANTTSNAVLVQTSSLSATKYTGYGNQTIVAGSNNAKLGAFTLSSGSTEGVTVNTIVVALSANNAASITNLTLKDDATGTTLGTIITTPSTSNSYALSLDIPRSSTKTIDIYGNVLSGANSGAIQATVKTTTTGVGDTTGISASVASDAALQTITVGTGSLAVTRGAGDPVSNNILAGASSVQVGEFNFAAQSSSYTVQNLAILVPNGAATSVTNVTVSYKDVNGQTQSATQALAVNPAMAYATATFTGLTMYVPTNDSANLDVFVGTPTVASGGTSGAAINVKLDTGNSNTTIDNTFRATNSAGAALTVVNSGTIVSSNGTFYLRKSIPSFAVKSSNSSIPGSPLYQFSVTADPAGAIEWSKLTFNIATTSATVTNVYLTDDSNGNNLLDNTTSSASTTATTITVDLTKNATQPQFQQVAAGGIKTYDLYGTVSGFTTGSTVTISLATDGSPVANGTAAAVAALPSNIVWSDRSANSHTIGSSDWTNGYLLKNFTNSQVSYSK